MHWSYSCPHCRAVLNPGRDLVLAAHKDDTTVLLALHPEPGNYEVQTPPGVTLELGARWRFLCPACHSELNCEDAAGLCALDLDVDGARRQVYFSPVAGEHATVVLTADGLEREYGDDVARYVRQVGWGPRVG